MSNVIDMLTEKVPIFKSQNNNRELNCSKILFISFIALVALGLGSAGIGGSVFAAHRGLLSVGIFSHLTQTTSIAMASSGILAGVIGMIGLGKSRKRALLLEQKTTTVQGYLQGFSRANDYDIQKYQDLESGTYCCTFSSNCLFRLYFVKVNDILYCKEIETSDLEATGLIQNQMKSLGLVNN